jgi:hypothetical protein
MIKPRITMAGSIGVSPSKGGIVDLISRIALTAPSA